MATACTLLTEDQFQCSICLEVFTEPVTIPCGHNSCKACLTRHWEGKDLYKCPLCNEKFPKDLKLRVNTGFREVVENVKELNAKADNACPVKPGEVPCDCCPDDNQSKASKTCLVCLTSFCETHIEPHLRVAALKRHTLTNPVHNLEDQICKKHNRMLERFCRNDQTCVCVLCTEHSTHDTVPLEEAYVDKRAQIGRKKKAEVQEMKHKHGKRAHKNKNTSQGKAEAMENNTVIHNMNNPQTWGIQDRFGRVALNGVLPQWRCYCEVQAEGGSSEDPAVEGESMQGVKVFIAKPKDGNWIIRAGSLKNVMTLHRVPVYLFCSPTSGETCVQRLQQQVERFKGWSQNPDNDFRFRCIFYFLNIFLILFCGIANQYLNHDIG
ncbi:E3 ubiquitin-protein ligase TRIM47-like [Gymnodraco acuticeps]|uniref:E3 ubiquitin-protein ligase TRIM47-like n=1 Tax=Gymnodraco acuticeps TaxID=8218 RepID=A0A6P8U0K9_GYMAC|nr:E3 ubiquitin-protein ligase TRIM47-like [Gymnodraco acuticeps]XP_034064476.1 E3 ubiquitin-protein ligase TRIM47-like [Gymnodraco acuticeps]XP_034064477.1 E3 ubiquitin-protein ligase TRIM47-like [Gymnodraco acuticeps]